MKRAIVIGATGMVGTQLIQLLMNDENYSKIISLVRRESGIKNPKLEEHIIDFDKPESWSNFVWGEVLFSTLGTTIAQAKTKEAQYKVDFEYQFAVAKIAAIQGVSKYVLISSAGSNSTSYNFYLKMKGELETAVHILPFKTISILKPGMLAGNRIKNRPSEKLAFKVMNLLNKLGLFKRYKPIQAIIVAQAMIMAAKENESSRYTLDEVFKLAD